MYSKNTLTSRKEQVAEDNVSWIKLDVRDPNNHVPITGELDLLICNAGVFLDRGKLKLDLVLKLNCGKIHLPLM